MEDSPSFSIVVNTNGRLASLRKTIDALARLDYDNVEVCVVYGPTNDGTKEYVESLAGKAKSAMCPHLNLSESRNIGIRISSGEFVAFIDDDGIPEARWLADLAKGFSDTNAAAVGGLTHDHTGYSFQSRFMLSDRLGDSEQVDDAACIADYNFPFSPRYPTLLGTNSAFRRRDLVSIGGFDEEFEYYLDETDVCCRLNDAGFMIAQLDAAIVHHKFLASHLRNEHRFLTKPYPVLKNKAYFALMHGRAHYTIGRILENVSKFFGEKRAGVEWGIANGKIGPDALEEFDVQTDEAWNDGLLRGLSGNRRTQPSSFFDDSMPFLPFSTLQPPGGRRAFVFLTQDYPPDGIGGVARYTHTIANAIAAIGHDVRVMTRGRDFNRVDLEGGVWVHRIVPQSSPKRALSNAASAPAHIWDYSTSMLRETIRVNHRHPIEVVEGPSWDCETAAFVFDGRFPVATNIVTSLTNWLDTHAEQRANTQWMTEFGHPMLALEKDVFERSDRIIAASRAIVDSISQSYGVSFANKRLSFCEHGSDDMRTLPARRPGSLSAVNTGSNLAVLFVGRLEYRKGIDTFLEMATILAAEYANAEYWVAGDDEIEIEGGLSAKEIFWKRQGSGAICDSVKFLGKVSDEELRWLYANCSVFVAPSRFESYGLIAVEAMMFGKPIVAGRAGGLMEVVEEGRTGLLAEAGNPAAFAAAVKKLIDSAELRRELGHQGRLAFERRFATRATVARRLEVLSQLRRKSIPASGLVGIGTTNPIRLQIDGFEAREVGYQLAYQEPLTLVHASKRVMLTFLKHDWSGVVEVTLGDGQRWNFDLYSATPQTVTFSVDVPVGGSSISIWRKGERNPLSSSDEVIWMQATEET